MCDAEEVSSFVEQYLELPQCGERAPFRKKLIILPIKSEQLAKTTEPTTSYTIDSRQFTDTKPVDDLGFGTKKKQLTDVVVTAPREPSLTRA